MNPLRQVIGRAMLFPALRLMRAQMRLISNPLHLRAMAARADALGPHDADLRTTAVTAGSAPGVWLDVPGARQDCVVLYLHGGAFVAETPKFHAALLARICREAGARGLMLSYRLAPEHRYPAALDDCIATYRWLLAQGFEARRIIVAGDSAGGNLTLALLLRARDEGLAMPAGAVALSPVADFTFSGESVRRNDGVDDMFTAAKMEALVPVYLGTPELCSHPYVSPVFGDYTGVGPLLLIVGSTELLLDDAVRVAQRCAGAQLLVWHGMPHVFPGFAFLPEARAATQRIGRFMRACLEREVAEQAVAEDVAETPAESAADPRAQSELPHALPTATLAPSQLKAKAWIYLALAVLTGAVPLILLVFAPLLAIAMWAHPAVWSATAVVGVFMWADAASLGWRRLLGCLAAAVLLGPGCGLALFLFLREAQLARRVVDAPRQ